MESTDQLLVRTYENTIFWLLSEFKSALATNKEMICQINELQIGVRRINNERKELTAAYKEAESGRKAEEQLARKMTTDLVNLWIRAKRLIQEKDDEIKAIRKQNRIEVEQLNARYIETVTELKREVTRIEKMLLVQTTELVGANRKNTDLLKTIQKHSLQTELEHTVVHLHEQQATYVKIEAIRNSLEMEFKNVFAYLEKIDTNAIAGGSRSIISELEARIKDLELEMDEEKRRHAETTNILREKESQLERVTIECKCKQKHIACLQRICQRHSEQEAVQSELGSAEEDGNVAGSNFSSNCSEDHTFTTKSTVPSCSANFDFLL